MVNPFEAAKVTKVALNAVEAVAKGGACEAFLRELAPTGIAEISIMGRNVIKAGEAARITSTGVDMTVGLTKEGRAFVSSDVPGYMLRGGELKMVPPGYGVESLSKFEQARTGGAMVPLEVGEKVPLGVNGDLLFRPSQSTLPAIEFSPTGGSIGGAHYLNIKPSRAYSVAELTEKLPASAVTKPLSWKF